MMESEVLKRITIQISDTNVKEALGDLHKLHSSFCAVVSLLHEQQIRLPHLWQEYYELMAIKFRLNVHSIMELYTIQDGLPDNVVYHDLSSIYLLNRSLLETYLTFFYSYVLPESDEEALMNYYIFTISGLVQRQAYGKDNPKGFADEWVNYLDKEKQTILNLKAQLQKLPTFIALDMNTAEKKKLVDGKYAKRYSFIDLIKISPLKNILFVDMWKLYSNYAHCELIGLLQISSYAEDPMSIKGALYGTLTNTLVVVSVMLKSFLPIFKNTDAATVDIKELDDEAITLFEFWYNMGTGA